MVRGKQVWLSSLAVLAAGCSTAVPAEIQHSQVLVTDEQLQPLDNDLQKTARANDGLVQVTLKFPRPLRKSDFGGSNDFVASVVLSDCRNISEGTNVTWGGNLQEFARGPLWDTETIELYFPRSFKFLKNISSIALSPTWADKAIDEDELCLNVWNATILGKHFQIAPIKLGKSTGFLSTGRSR
jgi:hypothetical protein